MYSPNLNTLMKMLEEDSTQSDDLPFSLFPAGSSLKVTPEPVKKLTKRKKVLLLSEHCHQYTNNSKVSWNLLKLMSKNVNLEAFHYGINQHDNINANFRPYPDNVTYISVKEITDELSGLNELVKYVTQIKPDIIVIYYYTDVVTMYLKHLKSFNLSNIKFVTYIDMLYYNISETALEILNKNSDKIFVTSNFWKSVLEIDIKKPIGVLHYGFDKEMMPALEKKTTRKKTNLPETGFTILSALKNTASARYDLIIKAYVKLIAKYPTHEIRLFCMCDKEELTGHSILEIYKQEIKNQKLKFANHLGKILLVPHNQIFNDDVKNSIFNCADVSICCPENEGLNLDSMEMMGIGLPQIVPKSGQFEEYCNDSNSTLIPIIQTAYLPVKMRTPISEVRTVDSNDIFLALENYLLHPELLMRHSKAAKDYIREFTWESTAKSFIDYLVG